MSTTTKCSREPLVAIYWDFENLQASVVDRYHGPGSYQKTHSRAQEALIRIGAIMDYTSRLGRVVINRAYANWQGLGRYQKDLLQYGIDPVQVFPRGMKNSADIRLALDAVEDLTRLRRIGMVVVISSDSDFTSLATKIRQGG